MPHSTSITPPTAAAPTISGGLTLLLAVACGAIVANLYYAQPLIREISVSVGLSPAAAGLVVTLTQLGYGLGLVLLVPLGDLLENRRLVVCTLAGTVAALALAAWAPSAGWFMAASLLIGVSSVTVQMLVPIAARMTPPATRGRVVGNVVGGLLAGILLARPIASLLADLLGWRAVFVISASLMAALLLVLAYRLPRWRPPAGPRYGRLLWSLWTLLRSTPLLRRRAAYQAGMFAAFSLFWTAVPLELAGPRFGFSQRGIALFALAGAAGALAAPIAGRIADRGWSRLATGISLAVAALAFGLARFGGTGSLTALVTAAILLDFGVQANLVLGQRAVFALGRDAASRLNGLYIAIFFVGGAAGSAIASLLFAHGGWSRVSTVGVLLPLATLLFYATELTGRRRLAET